MLVSNLPFPYLTVQQNDFFAGATKEKPALTECEAIATAIGAKSRREFESVETAIKHLSELWERVKHWGSNDRLIYLEEMRFAPLSLDVVGLRYEDLVQFPSEWKSDLESLRRYALSSLLRSFGGELLATSRVGALPEHFEILYTSNEDPTVLQIVGIRYHRLVVRYISEQFHLVD